MRVLLVNSLFPPVTVGGAEESVFELAKELGEDGHQVTVACLGPRPGPTDEPELTNVSVARWHTSVADRLLGDAPSTTAARLTWHVREGWRAGALGWLRSVVASARPDVVHTHSIAGFGPAAWAAAGDRPVVHTLRDYYLLCVTSRTYTDAEGDCRTQCGRCAVLRAPQRLVPARPDLFVGISEAVVDRHRSFGFLRGHDRTAVVANQPQLSAGVGPARQPSPAGTTFGFIGRLENYKGLWKALDAFRALSGSDHRFLVAGDGDAPAQEALFSRMATDSRIVYLGRCPKESFYAQVDVVMVPSQWHEPYGRVAGEAVRAGRTVLVSAIGGLPEAVAGSPHARVVDRYQDVAAWTGAMHAVLSPAGPTDRRGVTPAPSVADQYLALYATLTAAAAGVCPSVAESRTGPAARRSGEGGS